MGCRCRRISRPLRTYGKRNRRRLVARRGRLAVTDEGGGVGVWDTQRSLLLRHARVHEDIIFHARWSLDGQALATCSADGTINVQAADDLRLMQKLRGHTGRVYDIDLSPDGSLIASAAEDGTVRLWDLTEGTEDAVLEGHTGAVSAVRFSPNGDFLASASRSRLKSGLGELSLWRRRDWARVVVMPRPEFDGIGGVAFHPSQPLLAAKDQKYRRVDCYRVDYALLDNVGTRPGSRRYVQRQGRAARGYRSGKVRTRPGAERAAVPADRLDPRP